jgi:hypothetical protein
VVLLEANLAHKIVVVLLMTTVAVVEAAIVLSTSIMAKTAVPSRRATAS